MLHGEYREGRMSLVDAVPVAPSQGYTASSAVSLQVACAAIALFLLPFPALTTTCVEMRR